MKSLNKFLSLSVLIMGPLLISSIGGAAQSPTGPGQSGHPGWPRERVQDGNRIVIYQPQVDDWKNFQDLSWRMAVSLTPKSGKTVVGVVEMKGTTSVDNVAKLVIITDPEVTGTYFPSLDQATKEKMDQQFKTFVPP